MRKHFDKEIEQIIKKVNPKARQNKSSKEITGKYLNQRPESSDDPRLTNYHLQVENSNLQQKYRRLQKILKEKCEQTKISTSINEQILAVESKLREVLNLNKTLEVSLCKLRSSKASKTINLDGSESQSKLGSCCCSRVRSQRAQQRNKSSRLALTLKHVARENEEQVLISEVENYSVARENTFKRSPNKNESLCPSKPETKNQIVQCDLSYLEQERARIQYKKQYIEKLKEITEKQRQMVAEYEATVRKKLKIGQFHKVSQMRANNLLQGCPSVGTFIKTKKAQTNQ